MPTKTRAEVGPSPGIGLLLQKREKFCDTAQENQLCIRDHMLLMTSQNRSRITCQPRHSTAHGDKDQCDEKQQRWSAWTPFSRETLTPSVLQNHLNVFQRTGQERIFPSSAPSRLTR